METKVTIIALPAPSMTVLSLDPSDEFNRIVIEPVPPVTIISQPFLHERDIATASDLISSDDGNLIGLGTDYKLMTLWTDTTLLTTYYTQAKT